jgi:hypothetical protein
MRYLCYLSKERVDSLFETAFDGIVDEIDSKSSRSATGDAEAGFGAFLHLVKAGLKFGGKVSSSTETKRRQTSVSRLDAIIESIRKNSTVGNLNQVIDRGGPFDAEWFEVSSKMTVPAWNPASAVVDLFSRIGQFELNLSCGKENFSGLYKEGDTMVPSSTNRYLFEGTVSLPMSGLIKLAAVKLRERKLFGSPLFLILNPLNEDLGDYNDVEI